MHNKAIYVPDDKRRNLICLEIGGRPLFFLGILLMVTGGQVLFSGLLAEFILRQNMTEGDKYNIRAVIKPTSGDEINLDSSTGPPS